MYRYHTSQPLQRTNKAGEYEAEDSLITALSTYVGRWGEGRAACHYVAKRNRFLGAVNSLEPDRVI